MKIQPPFLAPLLGKYTDKKQGFVKVKDLSSTSKILTVYIFENGGLIL